MSSTKESIGNSIKKLEEIAKKPKRRFSVDSANDLLFWGVHMALVVISLTIVWSRLNATDNALARLITAQVAEVDEIKKQEFQRTIEFHNSQAVLADIIKRVETTDDLATKSRNQIRTDISNTLEKIDNLALAIGAKAESNADKAAESQAVAAQAKAVSGQTKEQLAAKNRQLKNAKKYINKQEKRNPLQRLFNTQ
jgi:hypothetical protein